MQPVAAGRIGPNAVIRLAEALAAVEGPQSVQRVFGAAHLADYLLQAPTDMLDEREVISLHQSMRSDVGGQRARTVAWIAGQRTADYLLRHRIPRLAQILLRSLPAPLASRLLAMAIARNAWTFAGSGRFSVRDGRPLTFVVSDCPICRGESATTPCCDFYAATFERLFICLVDQRARVLETECQALGSADCAFAITWGNSMTSGRTSA